MQPIIYINKGPIQNVYWDYEDAAPGGPVGEISYLGTIYTNELFVQVDDYGSVWKVGIRSDNAKFEYGYIPIVSGQNFDYAYGSLYDYGYHTYKDNYQQKYVSGYKFLIRRKCRIFNGTTEVTSIYPGDFVVTDGNSNGGVSHPYRLSIKGYQKNGIFYALSNGWCDTDIEIGYSMANEATTYGQW
ncbi:hypothetical protein [Aeribacillus pallidus]|uniref:hypothetical protein n=1 Tax=Aeribacillus pallidus TaxID=33936 RepID=UPI003D1F7630